MKREKQNGAAYLSIGMTLLFIILLAVSTSFVMRAKQELYEEKTTYLTEVSTKNAMLIQTKMEDIFSQMETVSVLLGDQKTFNLQQSLQTLKQVTVGNELKRMAIITMDGKAYTTDDYELNFVERAYFRKAMAGESNVSNRLVDKVDNMPISVFATPLYHNEVMMGVLIGTKNTAAMAELLNVNSFDGKGYSYIIESNGAPVVCSSNPNGLKSFDNLFDEIEKEPKNKVRLEKFREDIQNGLNGVEVFVRGGVERQVSYTKININGWYMISAVESAAISKGSSRLISSIAGGTLGALLIFAILSYAVANGFRKKNARLRDMAFLDHVTGFGNWNKFQVQVKGLLEKNKNQTYAIISVDIDRFKAFNDHFGHREGNQLLKYIALLMERSVGEHECFARVSADTFGILIAYSDEAEVPARLGAMANEVFNYEDGYHIQLSFGAFLIDDRSFDISAMYDRSTIARKTIKNRADIHYACYDELIRNKMLRENEIENSMEDALKNGEFEVYLQPKYLLASGHITGGEALVRWNRPNKGLVSPGEFIELFEKNGFIKKLDLYMFEQVCIILHRWNCDARFGASTSISVNLSRVHLTNVELPQVLLSITKKYDVMPSWIEIELTEGALFGDIPQLIKIMEEFKSIGFALSIDDFGSGYSSLNTLKDLPVDIVKLDRGFLQDATDHQRGKIIVQSLIDMTKILSLTTVAEGVETLEQSEFLRGAGCDIVQGFYFAHPMPVKDFEQKLKERLLGQ